MKMRLDIDARHLKNLKFYIWARIESIESNHADYIEEFNPELRRLRRLQEAMEKAKPVKRRRKS